MMCIADIDYSRAYLPFMPGWTLALMYSLFVVVVVVGLVGLYRRYQTYRSHGTSLLAAVRGRVGPLGPRLARALDDIVFQRKVRERRLPMALHFGIFYGMVALLVGTALIFLDQDILARFTSYRVLHGAFYVVEECVLDVAGLALVFGVFLALFRRLVLRPSYLLPKTSTLLILAGLLYVGLSGFVLEGYRIAAQSPNEWAKTAFVGYGISLLFDASAIHSGAGLTAYRALWWSHLGVAFSFLSALAYTGLSHILTIPSNDLCQDARRPRTQLTTPFNLADVMESEEDVDLVAGTASTLDLAPQMRLAVDACVACGRCHAECPANEAGRPLSPRDLVLALQETLPAGRGQKGASDFEKAVWSCTNCYACEEACPARIRHVDLVLDFRRALVDQNRLDEQKLAVLQALDRNQNPYRLPSHERAAWLSELPYADEVLFGSGAEPEYVYWLGCTAAYDVRASQAVRATFDLFRAAGVSFATLGPSERCCGEPAKRLGEEGRFQMLAMANIEMLRETGARAVVTHCPHCLNVLAHEYRSLGFEIPVKHHSELLAELMAGGCLAVEHGDEASTGVVYHEPCNLARSDRPGAPAFDLLVAATGDGVVVPPRSGRRTFCCGGGGANMWYTVEEESRRISAIRLDELVATGAPTVATSCPFCLSMLTDAAGSRSEKGIEIKDIAEVVYQCRERGETSGDSES